MKTYSLEDLRVVKTKQNNKILYVICVKNNFFQTYTNVLTGEKVKPIFPVEPLSHYYTIGEKFNYRTGKYVRLTKSELLEKYQEINEEKRKLEHTNKIDEKPKEDLTSIEKKDTPKDKIAYEGINVTEILEKATEKFFPKDGQWWSSCFNRSKELIMGNLPCNLRNDKWLAKMLQRDQNLGHINYYDILEFVKNSKVFEEARHNYELEIVKWQIDWIRNGGEGWISVEEYGGDAVFFMGECDYGFRNGVLNTLLAIGMDKEVIEEGLEKYSDLWREKYMKIAFHNEYEPVFYLADPNVELEPVDENHRGLWLKYRKYEYYQNYKRLVDMYGKVEEDMLITYEEARKIKEYIDMMDQERKEQIEKYKKEAYGHGRGLSLWG